MCTKKYDRSIRLVALRNITACGVCKFDEGSGLNAPRPQLSCSGAGQIFIFLSKKRPRPVATGPGCKKVAPRLHYFPNIMKYFGRSRSCGQNKVLVESWRAFLVIISMVRSSSVRLTFWLRTGGPF